MRALLRRFREHLLQHLKVSYQGVVEPIGSVVRRLRTTESRSIEELVRLAASRLLEPEFAERFPSYPTFSALRAPISEEGRPTSAMEAVRYLAGRARTNLGAAVLQGLELLDDEGNIRPHQSSYGQEFLDCLQAKPAGQVLNRGELTEVVGPAIERPIEKDRVFHLEPEWVAVVLLALVYTGDIDLTLQNGQTLDASALGRAANVGIAELARFRFCKRPRVPPIGIWVRVFEGLGLSPGLVRDENAREQGVRELQRVVGSELERAATLEAGLQQRPRPWNAPVFTDDFTIQVQAGVVVGTSLPDVTLSSADLLPHVREYK